MKKVLGALIGAILFSIPWVLVYVYLGWIFSLLGALIGFGAYKFYKWFGGKEDDKHVIATIVISSLISITVATFVIIPFFLLAKEGYGFNKDAFVRLYSMDKFVGAIIKDYFISFFFTILGISGIVSSIKHRTIKPNEDVFYMDDDAQLKHIESVIRHGGYSFLIISINEEYYLLSGENLLQFIKDNNRKSIPYNFIKEKGIKIELSIKPVLNYIKAVDILIKERIK